jgi:quercetin dioxygenase-like cupin family protein
MTTGLAGVRRHETLDSRRLRIWFFGETIFCAARGMQYSSCQHPCNVMRHVCSRVLGRLIQARPWSYREESTMSNEQVAPETKGVTVKLLATVDLGPEIEGMAGRQLRMRMVTIEPGGVLGPIHDHKDRPGTVYILQGTITDHRNGIATNYGPGVGWPEDRNTTHWLENRGTIPAVEISVDIVRQE